LQEVKDYKDDEAPAGIEGSQFFGGNKEKIEFFDPIAEVQAQMELFGKSASGDTDDDGIYNRFQDRAAFSDETVAAVASSLQRQMNAVLYEQDSDDTDNGVDYTYASNVQWTTPLQVKAKQPLQELETALGFYRRISVAVTSGEQSSNGDIRLTWQLSVVWPAFWQPRVLLTGSSIVTMNDKSQIVRQVDSLDNPDFLVNTIKQVLPRFWDFYHVGMSPSAEQLPKLVPTQQSLIQKLGLRPYDVYQLPGRLVLQPSIADTGSRDDNNAGMVPNHAFSCVIQTMGAKKQEYVTCSPIQVNIVPQETGPLRLQWSIPMAVELVANNPRLAIPPADDETVASRKAECTYQWEEARTVATLPYGGGPQDEAISDLRKRLYEQVTKDGLKPKLDASGRPLFFFWQNNVKACYTEEGLGMAVYDWRPDAVKANEVGIELEMSSGSGAIEQSR
jgi:hypothetical protein